MWEIRKVEEKDIFLSYILYLYLYLYKYTQEEWSDWAVVNSYDQICRKMLKCFPMDGTNFTCTYTCYLWIPLAPMLVRSLLSDFWSFCQYSKHNINFAIMEFLRSFHIFIGHFCFLLCEMPVHIIFLLIVEILAYYVN